MPSGPVRRTSPGGDRYRRGVYTIWRGHDTRAGHVTISGGQVTSFHW